MTITKLLNDVGERDGCLIKAVTDALGSHVVVTGQRHCLAATATHQDAIDLGKRVLAEGWDVCEWENPMELFEVAMAQMAQRWNDLK